jgi:hypothetical protein
MQVWLVLSHLHPVTCQCYTIYMLKIIFMFHLIMFSPNIEILFFLISQIYIPKHIYPKNTKSILEKKNS